MKKTVKAASVNCSVCGREVLSYQIRTAQLGSVLKEMCKSCHSGTSAYKKFSESLEILKDLQKSGQLIDKPDPMIDSPNISIEPIDSNIQAACELLKRMDPNYFKGISKIVAGTEANYGHTSSENSKILHINLNRIISEGKQDKRNIIIQLALTVAHEAAHSKSFKDGQFNGGESVSEAEEQKVNNWIKANESRLQDLFK